MAAGLNPLDVMSVPFALPWALHIKPVVWVHICWWLLLRLLLRNKSSASSVFNPSANINPYLIKRTGSFLPSSSRDPNLTWLFKPSLICRMRSRFVFLLRGLFEWQFRADSRPKVRGRCYFTGRFSNVAKLWREDSPFDVLVSFNKRDTLFSVAFPYLVRRFWDHFLRKLLEVSRMIMFLLRTENGVGSGWIWLILKLLVGTQKKKVTALCDSRLFQTITVP